MDACLSSITASRAILLLFQRAACLAAIAVGAACSVQARQPSLERDFSRVIRPFLQTHCLGCHDAEKREAELDLGRFASLEDVQHAQQTWAEVLRRIESQEMPPAEAEHQPSADQRRAVISWIQAQRREAAERSAGDPGTVLVRRLSNAEYNYTIRDLTGVDIRPTAEFPVDPANEAGFDNSGESLAMSPALLNKYLGAARLVADHLVLKPNGFAFAPYPVTTDTDRDKYCVNRIVDFYQRQPTDYADYFLAAWRFRHRDALGSPEATLAQIAADAAISEKYLATVWSLLTEADAVGPVATVQTAWRELPPPVDREMHVDALRPVIQGCRQLRDFVVRLRKQLEPHYDNLESPEVHKGSQPLVLWKNRQYAASRMTFDRTSLHIAGTPDADDDSPSGRTSSEGGESDDLRAHRTVPADPSQRALHEAAFARFCEVFPDAFYVSERGRDYLNKPKEQQEKGRLLSAGFHSMLGYFRDDRPLCQLILNEAQQQQLDALWQELDFIASAPMRQYTGFVWFERTDSRFMRDPQFDFARAEDKNVTSDAMIRRLGEVYLDKARQSGGSGTAIEAISRYFADMNASIRWVEQARIDAQPSHLAALIEFAQRAYRRPLTAQQRDDLLNFYQMLRNSDGLSHEEAMQDAVVSVLMSPSFCYRLDLLEVGQGTRPMTDYELASRLSYFLWSSMPDRQLLEQAAAGNLRDPHVLLAQTRRMLRERRIRGLAVEFGGNWLDFRHFQQHNSVDRERFPEFTNELRDAMFEEPVRFFVDLAQRDGSLLDFLYAEHTFVNAMLAQHYGIPLDADASEAADRWVRVDGASAYGRGGLPPMAVFLTQNAPGLRTSPVKRGYWVARRVLGDRIPPPPPNVPELPADESQMGDLTLREMLARHRDHASCASCHERFDSLGLVFEGYGPVGERRTVDLGRRPVQAAATFPDGSEGEGLQGLRDYLRRHRQQEFLDNFCRKLLSYALGRSLLLSDDATVQQMLTRLAAEQYRIGAAVEVVVTSRQFLNKRGRGFLEDLAVESAP